MSSLSSLLFPNTVNMEFLSDSCKTTSKQLCYICKEKCQFSFVNANLTAHYDVATGLITYNDTLVANSLNQSPFTFNENNYKIINMYLLSPSSGKYGNGEKNYCEFIIATASSYNKLYILIPVLVVDNLSKESFDFTEDSSGNIVTSYVNLALKDYIPQMPFVSYSVGSTPGDNYIVFPQSSLMISSKLKQMLGNRTDSPTYYDGPLYYNPNGPGDSPDSTDQIYINCTPTDHSQVASDFTDSNDDRVISLVPTSFLDKPGVFYVIVLIVTGVTVYITIKIILYIFTPLTKKELKNIKN